MVKRPSRARRAAARRRDEEELKKVYRQTPDEEDEHQSAMMALWIAGGDKKLAWALLMDHPTCAELAKCRASIKEECERVRRAFGSAHITFKPDDEDGHQADLFARWLAGGDEGKYGQLIGLNCAQLAKHRELCNPCGACGCCMKE